MDDAPSRFCLDCRALLDDDTACDAGRYHRVVSLSEEPGRERARSQVWGPRDLRQRAADSAKVGGVGAFFQGALESCSGCPLEIGGGLEGLAAVLLAMVVVFFVVGLLFWLAATLYGWIRRWLTRLRPTGVRGEPPRRRDHVTGTIVAGSPTPTAPGVIGEQAGVAWGLHAESSDAIGKGPLMLSAGRTGGFSVQLDDGRTLEVPAGRVRVAPGGEGWSRVSVRALKAWLSELDRRLEDELHPPIPADRGRAVVLEVGDRVELSAKIERVASHGGAYRQSANRLRTRGVPVLSRL